MQMIVAPVTECRCKNPYWNVYYYFYYNLGDKSFRGHVKTNKYIYIRSIQSYRIAVNVLDKLLCTYTNGTSIFAVCSYKYLMGIWIRYCVQRVLHFFQRSRLPCACMMYCKLWHCIPCIQVLFVNAVKLTYNACIYIYITINRMHARRNHINRPKWHAVLFKIGSYRFEVRIIMQLYLLFSRKWLTYVIYRYALINHWLLTGLL